VLCFSYFYILDQPEWRDVVWLPRNGGRVVFRSRFPDYVGAFVNHCHILIHEDHGMMQTVETTPFAERANYELRESVASSADTADAVTAIYPRLSQAEAYVQSLCFIDPNHASGQTYPGFVPGSAPTVAQDPGFFDPAHTLAYSPVHAHGSLPGS